ncbi:MAG: AAA family ATPase, partial [Lentisphaeria bacterium]|nr:AAA family ATPase [Lentisphaeria bacterium]
LKLMEDTEVKLLSQTDMLGQMQAFMQMQATGETPQRTIRTRHILFIVSGAFDKLPEQIQGRLGDRQIGFGRGENGLEDELASHYLKQLETRDLVEYGFEPEFVGRLPVRVVLDELDEEDLRSILVGSEGSVLNQYRDDFAGYGIDLDVGEDAISEIARQAHGEKTGARGLMTVLERLLRDFKFELPSGAVKALSLNAETVADPTAALRALLDANRDAERTLMRRDVLDFAQRLGEAGGVTLVFTPEAADAIAELSLSTGQTVRMLCEERFRDFVFGLELIVLHSDRREFTVTPEGVENPTQVLSDWIRESYHAGADASAAES